MDILEGDSDSEVKLTINKNFAERYDIWRQGEELQKLKDRYGDTLGSESSTSEEEDDDAIELTKDIEKNFFKTLSCLKEKNPKIYDNNVRFFEKPTEDTNTDEKPKKKKQDTFLSVGDYQRKLLLEKGGVVNDEDEDEKSLESMTNVEQEKYLKDSFKDVLQDSDDNDEEENWGRMFKKRVKTEEELKNEEEDYKLWLSGEKKRLENEEEEKELKGLKDFWSNPALDEGEQFLRDFILNKRFLEKDDKSRIPTYDEIIHDSDSGLSADENTLQQQEVFERKYNFRFEEPDQEFIKRYPRTLENSMRKKDDRRKKHREQVKARKETEKQKKAEELKRLKFLKKKEIMDKIKKLQEITGNDDIGFKKNDIEDDFDPEEHDRRMSEIFNDNYYGTCTDKHKPENAELDEELEIENWDDWGGEGSHRPQEYQQQEDLHCEDPGFNMDCDYDPNAKKELQKELLESTKKRKRRRQSKFAAAVAREKPVFDPKDKNFEKYVDEYYSLDYEDLIGDLPCRFKYRKVVPNDFGLTVEEILAAPDKELNSWVSLKKIMQRRPQNVELYDVKAFRKKAKDFNKKQKCLPSLYGTEEDTSDVQPDTNGIDKEFKVKHKKSKSISEVKEANETLETTTEENVVSKKKKKKKKNKKPEDAPEVQNESKPEKKKKNKESENASDFQKETKSEKKKKKNNWFPDKKKKNKDSQELAFNISDKRLQSYGINPKKFKNKLKYKKS